MVILKEMEQLKILVQLVELEVCRILQSRRRIQLRGIPQT